MKLEYGPMPNTMATQPNVCGVVPSVECSRSHCENNTPFTRYNGLSNRFDNRLYRVNKHPTGYQTGFYNRFDNRVKWTATVRSTILNEQPLFIELVVKPVWQPVVSCIQTFNWLSIGSQRMLNAVDHIAKIIPRLHDTTGCTTRLTTVLNEQPLFV